MTPNMCLDYTSHRVLTLSHFAAYLRIALQAQAALIIVYANTGRTASLVAKYRPAMPILTLVVPRLKSNTLGWELQGRHLARQCLIMRGGPAMLDMLQIGLHVLLEHVVNGLALPLHATNALVQALCMCPAHPSQLAPLTALILPCLLICNLAMMTRVVQQPALSVNDSPVRVQHHVTCAPWAQSQHFVRSGAQPSVVCYA